MPLCTYCSGEVDELLEFCPHCSAPLEQDLDIPPLGDNSACHVPDQDFQRQLSTEYQEYQLRQKTGGSSGRPSSHAPPLSTSLPGVAPSPVQTPSTQSPASGGSGAFSRSPSASGSGPVIVPWGAGQGMDSTPLFSSAPASGSTPVGNAPSTGPVSAPPPPPSPVRSPANGSFFGAASGVGSPSGQATSSPDILSRLLDLEGEIPDGAVSSKETTSVAPSGKAVSSPPGDINFKSRPAEGEGISVPEPKPLPGNRPLAEKSVSSSSPFGTGGGFPVPEPKPMPRREPPASPPPTDTLPGNRPLAEKNVSSSSPFGTGGGFPVPEPKPVPGSVSSEQSLPGLHFLANPLPPQPPAPAAASTVTGMESPSPIHPAEISRENKTTAFVPPPPSHSTIHEKARENNRGNMKGGTASDSLSPSLPPPVAPELLSELQSLRDENMLLRLQVERQEKLIWELRRQLRGESEGSTIPNPVVTGTSGSSGSLPASSRPPQPHGTRQGATGSSSSDTSSSAPVKQDEKPLASLSPFPLPRVLSVRAIGFTIGLLVIVAVLHFLLRPSDSGETPTRSPELPAPSSVSPSSVSPADLSAIGERPPAVPAPPATPPPVLPPSPPPGMLQIPPGTYTIGNTADVYSSPPHEVTLTQPFWIDPYEVSQSDYAQYLSATGATPPPHWNGSRTPPPGTEQLPMTRLTLAEAEAYARWAGKSLPTETEWEVAASGSEPSGVRQNATAPLPVTASPPQGQFRLFHILGNVWEWTSSPAMPYTGSSCPDIPPGQQIIRGGSYADPARRHQPWYRNWVSPDTRSEQLGFRCVWRPSP